MNRRADLSDKPIFMIVAMAMAIFLIVIGFRHAYAKPKEVLTGVYENLGKKAEVVGDSTIDQDRDKIGDDVDVCCDCSQIGETNALGIVERSGTRIGCAPNQKDGKCETPCPSGVA